MAGEAETLKNGLETFASLNPDLNKRLVGEVYAGITAQEKKVDTDFD